MDFSSSSGVEWAQIREHPRHGVPQRDQRIGTFLLCASVFSCAKWKQLYYFLYRVLKARKCVKHQADCLHQSVRQTLAAVDAASSDTLTLAAYRWPEDLVLYVNSNTSETH